MGEWGDAFNYDHASKESVVKVFKRLKKMITAYEDKCWIFEFIDNATLKKLHEKISGVISKINGVEKFYGYYVYVRDMRKALDTLEIHLEHGGKKDIAKAYGDVLYNAGLLIGVVPLLSVYSEALKSIGSKFAEFVNKIGPTRGNSEYDEFFK
jgi:hypothetical protein